MHGGSDGIHLILQSGLLGQELNVSEIQSRSATHSITKFGSLIFYVLNFEIMCY